MLDWAACSVVERDLQRVSGEWVFCSTRVPVSALFENLEDGIEITEFVDLFPGVTLEQARTVLDHAAKSFASPKLSGCEFSSIKAPDPSA